MKRQRGDALIEAVLSLTVVIVIITAVVMAVIASLNSSGYSENQNIATNYAQEGIEVLRDKKGSDFAAFSAITNGYWCLNSQSTTLTAYSGCSGAAVYNIDEGTGGKYKRTIYIDHNGKDRSTSTVCVSANTTYVVSIVVWTDSKCAPNTNCHKVEDASCFTNTNALSAP